MKKKITMLGLKIALPDRKIEEESHNLKRNIEQKSNEYLSGFIKIRSVDAAI